MDSSGIVGRQLRAANADGRVSKELDTMIPVCRELGNISERSGSCRGKVLD